MERLILAYHRPTLRFVLPVVVEGADSYGMRGQSNHDLEFGPKNRRGVGDRNFAVIQPYILNPVINEERIPG